jgi:hypothetical protein
VACVFRRLNSVGDNPDGLRSLVEPYGEIFPTMRSIEITDWHGFDSGVIGPDEHDVDVADRNASRLAVEFHPTVEGSLTIDRLYIPID